MTIAKIKYFDRDTLLDAASTAIERDYNRAVGVEWLSAKLDEDMVFPITFAMVHEHIAGKPAEPHMRTMIVINGEGSQIMLDVDMDVYNNLPHIEIDRELAVEARQELLNG